MMTVELLPEDEHNQRTNGRVPALDSREPSKPKRFAYVVARPSRPHSKFSRHSLHFRCTLF